jgi:hypothetical protein
MWNDFAMIASVSGQVCAGLVFCLAAAGKFQHWPVLRGVIANYRLLPEGLVAPAAAILPPLEMTLGILLLSGLARGAAAATASLLLSLFAAAMAINLRRGRAHIDCGCNQSFLKQELHWALVARNAVLMLALLPALAVAGPVPWAALLAGSAAGAAFFMLYLMVNVFSALPGPGRMAI